MVTALETLEKLERRITFSIDKATLDAEIAQHLKQRARTAQAPGFRPGKVPLKMVEAQYGYQIRMEALENQVNRAFYAALSEAELKIAGMPKFQSEDKITNDMTLGFSAVFEVFPEVKIGELGGIEIEKNKVDITGAEIDRTLEILRQQRVHYHEKSKEASDGAHQSGSSDNSAQKGDRLTIDSFCKIDGVESTKGRAKGHMFVLGAATMLPEIEAAAQGMKTGESKNFSLVFPENYQAQEVAGKTAEVTLTVQKIEWPHLPPIDADFARSLGIEDGNIEKMREDIRSNLERETTNRINRQTKNAVMDRLLAISEFDTPKSLIERESENLFNMARQNAQQRGEKMELTPGFSVEIFAEQAKRRVQLGLIISQLVEDIELKPDMEQIKDAIQKVAQVYDNPQQVEAYFLNNAEKRAEIEALALEENVVKYVLSKARITEKVIPFEELIGIAP